MTFRLGREKHRLHYHLSLDIRQECEVYDVHVLLVYEYSTQISIDMFVTQLCIFEIISDFHAGACFTINL